MLLNAVLDLQRSRSRTITVCIELDATEEGAIMRATGCNQPSVVNFVLSFAAVAIANLVDAGKRGQDADRLIQNGSIEVGRPANL